MLKSMQDLHLEMIERSSFNFFDAPRVVASLKAHRELWAAAYMRWEEPGAVLRDLPFNKMHMDTLYLLTTRDLAPKLEALARSWKPDDFNLIGDVRSFLGRDDAGDCVVFRVWWD